jgi:hypothetical protein
MRRELDEHVIACLMNKQHMGLFVSGKDVFTLLLSLSSADFSNAAIDA